MVKIICNLLGHKLAQPQTLNFFNYSENMNISFEYLLCNIRSSFEYQVRLQLQDLFLNLEKE